MSCSVIHCPSLPGKDLTFFNFPDKCEENRKWIEFCGHGIDWKINKENQVCELHFKDADKDGVSLLKVLKDGALPKILFALKESSGGIRSINRDSCRICLSTDDLDTHLISLAIKHNGVFTWEMLEYATSIQVC